jgi:hypothetical protein
MFYTTAAKNSLGGTNGIKAQCQAAVDKANDCHDNSVTNAHLTMVNAEELSGFSEENSYSNMLSSFSGNSYARSERDYWAADLVGLLVSNRQVNSDTSVTNGLAYLYNGSDERAYSVTNYLDATTIYVFGHESGHNFGCGHADSDPQSPGSFSFARGYKFTLNLIGLYRTVMAYDETGAFRTLIPYFSTPEKSYKVGLDSATIGKADYADNTRAIRTTVATVANFRSVSYDDVYVDLNFTGTANGTQARPFPLLSLALLFVNPGGTIHIRANNYNEQPTIYKAVTIVKWDGSSPVQIGAP